MLEKLCNKISTLYKYNIILGAEIEFYIIPILEQQVGSETIVSIFAEQGVMIEQERGRNQYEVHIPAQELQSFIIQYQHLKQKIEHIAHIHKLKAVFLPKPFHNDYGSSSHIHLNLVNTLGENIFSIGSISENLYLLYVINGILELLDQGLFYITTPEDFPRFDHKFMAPTNISWGGNNRTTSIRIPDSSPVQRRIEFRIPGANCDINKMVIFLLISVLYGLKKSTTNHLRIYGNAYDKQYGLTSLPCSSEEAYAVFKQKRWLKKYLTINKFIT